MRLATYDFGGSVLPPEPAGSVLPPEPAGSRPPILFVHATGFHARTWLPVIAELQSAFHCYGYDQRAHGDSEVPGDDGYEWALLGGDTLRVVDDLGLDSPFGVGHSSGAAALLLAEEARPGTFAGLWGFEPIVVPSLDPVPSAENPLADGARRRREVFADRDAAFDNYAGKRPFSALDPAALRAYVDHGFDDLADGTVRLKCRGENEARFYMTQGGHTAFRDLGAVKCPVTLMRGDYDAFPASFVGPIAERLGDARVEVLADGGHFGPLEQPAAIAASIANAFARH